MFFFLECPLVFVTIQCGEGCGLRLEPMHPSYGTVWELHAPDPLWGGPRPGTQGDRYGQERLVEYIP